MYFPLVGPDFGIWEENWPVFEAFCAIRTQWRTGMAGATGLDYPAVIGTLKELGFKKRKSLLEGIKVMETEIVAAWAEERNSK